MKASILLIFKCFLKKHEKTKTAYVCLGIVTLLIVIILSASNGVESHLRAKYKGLGKSYILVTTNYYASDFLNDLKKQTNLNVEIEVEKYYVYKDVTYRIIATTDETKSYTNGTDFNENVLLKGRFFNEFEKRNRDNSILIDEETEKMIFQTDFVLGSKIIIGGNEYKVVGIIEKPEEYLQIESDTFINKDATIYMPLKAIPEDELSGNNILYYIPMDIESVSNIKEYIKEYFIDREVSEYSILTSEEIDYEIKYIKNLFQKFFLGIAVFSIVTGALVLINTIKLLVIDLYQVLLFWEIQGITKKYIYIFIFGIAEAVSIVGVLIGTVLGGIVNLIIKYSIGFNLYLTYYEIVLLNIFSVIVALIAFGANIKRVKQLNIMDYFRN